MARTSALNGSNGVLMQATTGTTYGVFGSSSSPSGYGVYSYGNAWVNGKLTVTGYTFSGGICVGGNCPSDARLKKNIQPFSTVLDKLVRLQPVSFNWRVEEYPEYNFGPGRNSGLIAQELEEVFPEMVSTNERGYKGVNYSELPLLLLQAIRELKVENDTLREKVEQQQEAKITALRGQVEQLQESQTEIRQLRADVERLKASEKARPAALVTTVLALP